MRGAGLDAKLPAGVFLAPCGVRCDAELARRQCVAIELAARLSRAMRVVDGIMNSPRPPPVRGSRRQAGTR